MERLIQSRSSLKSRILAFIKHRSKITDADLAIFFEQLADLTILHCTIPLKEVQELFNYFRMEMKIYGLKTPEELEMHLNRSEKRHKARIHKYRTADLLDKISMEWKAGRVFDLGRQETASSAHVEKQRVKLPVAKGTKKEAPTKKKVPRISHQPRKRKNVKTASCY